MENAKIHGGRTNIYSWTHWFIGSVTANCLPYLRSIQIRRFNKPALMFDCTCVIDLVIIFGLHNKQREAFETHLELPTSRSYLLDM